MHSVFRILSAGLLLSIISCTGKKHAGKNPYASDRELTITFHPFWGGAAICDLQRKNGGDALFFEYDQQFNGKDSVAKQYVSLSHDQCDTLFYYAEKIKWTQPISDGTAEDKVGLKVEVAYKKKTLQKMEWAKLKSTDELPADVLILLHRLNDLAPENFKMF